jgi:hypothetical protein
LSVSEINEILNNKCRPSLGKACVYSEDAIQTSFQVKSPSSPLSQLSPNTTEQGHALNFPGLRFAQPLSGLDPFSNEALRKPIIDITVRSQAVQILGSLETIPTIAASFFVGIHQRISVLAKDRFYSILSSTLHDPQADFLVLSVCMHLIQQMPSSSTSSMQSSDYVAVKGLICLLEGTSEISLDLVHSRLLLTLYEMGHGLHTAAYVSIAACARMAHTLGFHRKPWKNLSVETEQISLEEKKRTWWEIVNLDRFINLCVGDARFATDDPESLDPLPIEDMLWAEGAIPGGLVPLISAAPVLSTPATVTVGQLARECQILHLTGRAIRHAFDPTPDADFNSKEARQLERTLKAFLPLLANEELRIGKYCGALGVCNRFEFS